MLATGMIDRRRFFFDLLSAFVVTAMVGVTALNEHVLHAQTDAESAHKNDSPLIIQLFNGKDLTGWQGREDIWLVEDGELVARTSTELTSSSGLVTSDPWPDCRWKFEYRLATPDAAVSALLWGQDESATDDQTAWSGTAIGLSGEFGIWSGPDASMVVNNADVAQGQLKADDWNRVEILAIGSRLRVALNGQVIAEWNEPDTARTGLSPRGLQIGANASPQEVRFRRMLLETSPLPKLVTVEGDGEAAEPVALPLYVDPATPGLWSSNYEVVVPDNLLEPINHPRYGLKTLGIRAEEANSFYGLLKKVGEIEQPALEQAAMQFRQQRHQQAFDGRYAKKPFADFPSYYDLYEHPDDYHGKLLTLHGHIRKLIPIEADDNPYGVTQYWEAWMYDEDGQTNPAVVVALRHDGKLPTGTEVAADHVVATGYFFKNFGYTAQDTTRFAPLFICQQIESQPPRKGRLLEMSRKTQWQVLTAIVVSVVLIRLVLKLWRKASHEESERRAVLDHVEFNQPPRFDNVTDNGGVLFPSAPTDPTAADAESVSSNATAGEAAPEATGDSENANGHK